MNQPLIVGAGPVGLGAALFLARHGIKARVVDKCTEPNVQSRALAVNPRTLDFLEPTGITQKMLAMGKPIRGMQFHRDGRVVAQVVLDGMKTKYPYMLGLSQGTTERLLAEALTAAGGHVERGLEMTDCRNTADGIIATLQSGAGNSPETVAAPWLLAADGAHSVARHAMNMDFPGSTLKDKWFLADVRLRTALDDNFGHVYFLKDSAFLFLFRVIDDIREPDPAGPVWRVLGNRPDPISQLVEAVPIGEPVWASEFRVAHRIVTSFSVGNVYFAGDAAHIHSPMGARGMNLGLEDACVFAALAATGRLSEYNSLRRPVDHRVVKQVEFFSRLVSSDSWITDFTRRYIFPTMLKTPIRDRIRQTVTGLDHELPDVIRNDAPQRTLPASVAKSTESHDCEYAVARR
jgi:2-polyprenyl-6-methoxyphenol hydroxylase-like FAD-dependent oxidoreductase